MSPEAEALAMLRGQLIEICFGTTFVVIGLVALAVAAIRRRTGVRAVRLDGNLERHLRNPRTERYSGVRRRFAALGAGRRSLREGMASPI